MKYLKKVSYISFIILAIFFCCSFVNNIKLKKVHADDNNDNIVLSVSKVKKTVQKDDQSLYEISGDSKSSNLYENLSIIKSNNNNNEIDNEEVVLLDKNTDCVLVTLLPKQDTGYTISNLVATLTINGTNVPISTYSLDGSISNSAYLQAFDFTQLNNNMGSLIADEDMDGLYEFEFSYSFSFYDKGVYKVENGSKTIKFYLLDESEYIGSNDTSKINYKGFSKTFSANKEAEQKATYFYNYKSSNPTITFNPNCFNINIQYSYKDDVVNLSGCHELDASGNITGFKLISSNDNVIHDIVAKKSDDNYILTLNQIGFYDVSYEFVFKNNNELTILNGEKIANVIENNYENLSGSNVYIFGYEAYYKDYANALTTQSARYEHFYTNDISTDFSNKLTSDTDLNNAKTLFELANEKHAVTNQAQVKLNDYANLNTGYYYYSNDNFNTSAKTDYSNSTRFTENGQYVVVLTYNFSKYDELNNSTDETFTQLIIFEIKNTTPTLNLTIGDSYTDNLNINGFTNKNVKVSWDNNENNPFILQPKLIFRKNGTNLSDVNIIKENSNNSVIFEEDGNYTIELRYGLGYNTIIEKTFTIDKTSINFSLLYNFSDDSYEKISANELNVKNLNNSFAIQIDNKAIENNTVSATYSYVPFTSENISASDAIVEIGGSYYIQNGYKLSNNLFENIDYSFVSGSNQVTATNKINANGLYKFILKDKAGNEESIFIFLDNTTPTTLQIFENLSSLNLISDQKSKLSYKTNETNLVSESYSLVFGKGKAISLNDAKSLNMVEEFIELNGSEIKENYKLLDYKNVGYTSINLVSDNENVIENLDKNNGFLSIKKPNSEIDRQYTLTLTDYFENSTFYDFEINTDKSLILIWVKDKLDTELSRILPNSSTNKQEVYIRYQNDYVGSEYEITELSLKFYDFNSDYTNFNTSASKTFNLLTSSISNTESVDNITGGLITNTYVNAHYDKNAVSVTQSGKYEIIKTYKNGTSQSYIFYVDRFKPIERINSSTIVGNNLIFKLGDKELSGTTILNYINNNQAIKTNFKLTSLPTTSYKYANINNIEAFKLNYSISYLNNDGSYKELFSGTNEQYNCDKIFKDYGTYKIKISDVSENYVEFNINYSDELVKGNFITKDDNIISANNTCTASNELYFSFESAENEYMYNVDIYNIELYADNLLILKTSKEKTTDYKGAFNIDSETTIYYKSPYYSTNNNLFKLVREKISTTRYKYTLTILNGDSLNSAHPLYENGQSKELTYRIKLSYDENSDIFTEKLINIDHTSPTKNAETLINSDKFLSDDEKTELLESIKNKDNTSKINFENYVLAADENFTFATASIKETSSIYYRKYDKFVTEKMIENYQSLVPGDVNFEGTITNRYRFNANLQDDKGRQVYSKISSTNLTAKLGEIFGTNYGCYEIIEIDIAENYTIYSIEYVKTNEISITYQAETTTGTANAITNYVEINDVNLEISEIKLLSNESGNLTDFVNVNITKDATTTLLRISASGIENQFNSISALIAKINSILSESNDGDYGVSYTLTFQGRFGEPIVIAFNEPQEELQLTWQEYENRFVVTIPQSQGATSINEFNVYPAVKNDKNEIVVSETSLERDSNGQAIITKTTTSNMVGGRSYIFTNTVTINTTSQKVYVYKIVWKDNFGRENSAYKVIGIKDVHDLVYSGPTEKIGDSIYTYQDVILRYQMQSYNLNISLKNLDTDEIKESLDISLIKGDTNSIAEFNVLDYLTQFNWNDNQVEFNIKLTSILQENGVSQVFEYDFIYYPVLPDVVFTDSSNSELQPAKSTSDNYQTYLLTTSKNVTLSYENSVFPVTLGYTLTYLVNDGSFTENYSNISSETTLTKIGEYIITITNSLGHSVLYRFAIREASLYPYAVIVSQLGVQSFELNPSEIPLQININGSSKFIETYYSIYDTTIEVNADNNLYYKDVTDSENISSIPTEFEGKVKIYLIEPKDNTSDSNKIYIAIVKVPYTDDFLLLSETEAEKRLLSLYVSSSTTSEVINKYSYVVTEMNGARLTLSKNYNTFNGNIISTKIYFNNKLINVNFKEKDNLYELNLTEAGTYDIYFEDFAGNGQLFKGNSFLRVIVLNEVIVNLNGENYVDYQVFNNSVYLSILQANLYSTKSFSISALLNGQDYNKNITSYNGQYVFSHTGLYTITLKAKYNSIDIETVIHFIIINPNIAYSSFSYAGLNGYTINKIERNNEDITNDLKVFFNYGLEFTQTEITNEYSNGVQTINANNIYMNSLNLASKLSYKRIVENADEENNEVYDYITGSGKYKITVMIDNNSVLSSSTFTFNVWIREEKVNLVIKPSINEGESTTKAINITFNPYLIYSQIGECSIVANEVVLYTINADSVNEKTTINLPDDNKTYTVQLKSNDNVEMSFAVTKKEPLSTVSIIVICIASVILAAAIFLFLRLRIKMKVK